MAKKLFVIIALVFAMALQAAIPTADTVTNSIGMKFKRIPAGTFEMGFEGRDLTGSACFADGIGGFYNEYPRHPVTLSRDFYMGVCEVTNAQFKQFRPNHGSDIAWYPGRALQPATRMTWFGADSFCAWLTAGDLNGWTYRLPTEAEWEYCCRAGTSTWFSTGDSLADANTGGSGGRNYYSNIEDVCQHAANPWGLYDMHGNAEEWCLDWMARYPSAAQTNPAGPASGSLKAVRSLGSYDGFARTVARGSFPPISNESGWTGFRVVISPLTADSLQHSAPDSPQPYQNNVAAGRPAPSTLVSGEQYTDAEGLAFTRVRMGRGGYPSQKDSVVYVSTSPVSNDSATTRILAGYYARRLSVTYGVLYRLSNPYEVRAAGLNPMAGSFLTVLPDIKYQSGRPHPDVAYFQFRRTAGIPTPSPLILGPVGCGVNHNSFIGEAPNGDILNAWYSGVSEDLADQVTAGSRLRLGENAWDTVISQICDFAGYVDESDVFWDNGRGVLYDYHGMGAGLYVTLLRKSTDNGVTWSAWQPAFNSLVGKSFFRLGGDSIVDLTDYGGSCSGYCGGQVALSTDGGETWALGPSPCGSGYHTSGAMLDNGTLIAFQRGDFVKNQDSVATMLQATTTDLGRTWARTATPFTPPGTGCYEVCLKLQSGRLLMASLNNGVKLAESLDSGKTWFCRRALDPSLSYGYKDMCQGRDGVIHLQGTMGSGGGANGELPQASFTEQWLREGTCLDITDWGINTAGRVSSCPDEDTLITCVGDSGRGASWHAPAVLTASPNPFNPAVVFIFAAGTAGRTTLAVYDIRGKRVKALFSSDATAGLNRVVFDASRLPSGVYVARLTMKDKVLEKRISLVK